MAHPLLRESKFPSKPLGKGRRVGKKYQKRMRLSAGLRSDIQGKKEQVFAAGISIRGAHQTKERITSTGNTTKKRHLRTLGIAREKLEKKQENRRTERKNRSVVTSAVTTGLHKNSGALPPEKTRARVKKKKP